ncbi:arylsulfatase [Luethyella okanaganae]|uniref:Arylsulfatase n=1 Tax=Luethyella okanaganae TaxID=69372 RepID=A0ABW1VD04_9MICO
MAEQAGGMPTRGYEGFAGIVRERASESVPAWPTPKRAAPGSPNVVVVLVDDMGFSDVSPFGSEIDTPNVQALADDGYRFSNYHTTPLCSPSRAALLTGLNPHRAGFASVAHVDPGFPGFRLELADDVATLAESLRAGGYATFAVGKWHLTKESKLHDGADKSSWPLQRGFDRYYGSMDGYTTLFHPHRLVCDNSPVVDDDVPDDRYLTDELTERALGMIGALRANDAEKPFFLYFAHQAVHGPIQAKDADIQKYRGRYAQGWGLLREQRFAAQLHDGLFPEGTVLAPSDPQDTLGVPEWDELSDDDRRLFARHMEVYAAAVDGVDQSLGALISRLKELGEYENTVFVFTSDNGATGEGGVRGTRSYFSQFVHLAGLPDDWTADVERELELMGGPRVHGHYPRGWAHVSNTPFRRYKMHAYAGGIHAPLVVSWPAGRPRASDDTGLREQYAYVTDIAPTVLALAGVAPLARRCGAVTQEPDGVSFAPTLEDARADSSHHEQYVECGGQRAYFSDGWKAIAPRDFGGPIDDGSWELYDTRVDPTETRNVAAEHPSLLAGLAERWRRAAWMNTVFPLDDIGMFARRPSTELPLSEPVTIMPGTATLERFRSSKLTLLRSFAVDALLTVHPGDEGVLVAHGDQGGGYVLFVEAGRLGFSYNAYGVMRRWTAELPDGDGERSIGLRFDTLAGMRWTVTAHCDGEPIGEELTVPQLLGMAPFTGISVGIDRGGPVDWELHERRRSFPYSGGLRRVMYTPGVIATENPEIVIDIERVVEQLSE